MDKKRKHIDDFFRDKLGGYSEVPPSDAWLDMDKKLDTLVPHVAPNPYRWLGHIGIVSLIAVLGVSVVNKFSGEGNPSSQISYNNQSINKIETTTESKNTDTTPAQPREVAVPAIAAEENNDITKNSTGRSIQADALAFGESYSENADNEYVEGVTEIKKEDTYLQSNGNSNYKSAYINNRNNNVQYNGSYASGSSLDNAENTGSKILNNSLNNIENQYFGSNSENGKEINTINAKVAKSAETVAIASKVADKTRVTKPDFTKWEAGIKAGYERGFSNQASTGFAVSPYVTYNISKKVGIMLQPTAKLANAPVHNIGSSQSYYKVNDDANVTAVESFVTTGVEGTTVTYYNNTRFRYTQSHDSIVKTNRAGGKYVQFELPVLVNYKIGKKISVYGGVNTVYSQLQTVTEHTYTKTGIVQTTDVLVKSKTTPVAPATNDVINHNGTPYSEYNGPVYPANHESNLRVGAMAGVNYEYNKRWLIDAMVQKTPAPANVKSGYDVNAPLSAPSFRLSVGYKIKK